MGPIRKLADHVVDTSEMTVHELRHTFTGVGAGSAPGAQLVVTVLSFGFKHGIPVDSDLLFDVRFLPNPHFVPALRPHTGRDAEVVRFLDRSTATHEFLEHTLNLLKFLVPQYVHEGKIVPDDWHRLHRRAAPIRRHGGSAEERVVRDPWRSHQGETQGYCERVNIVRYRVLGFYEF